MKYKILATCTASALLVACNTKDRNVGSDTTNDSKAEVENTSSTAVIQPSVVSDDLAKVAKVFNGEKYVTTELSHKPAYFILYYTASW